MITRGSGEFQSTINDKEGNEIEVTVKYKGYSDPGRISGPPEDCYPPEGEIEIEVSAADVTGSLEGEKIDEKEHERLEEEAWTHLMEDDQGD